MSTYTFDSNLWSDLSKDAWGYRDRSGFFYAETTTDDQRQRLWDSALEAIEDASNEQKKRDLDFERSIENALLLGASNRIDAIRWLIEAESIEGIDDMHDKSGYICYHMNLSYAYANEFDNLFCNAA